MTQRPDFIFELLDLDCQIFEQHFRRQLQADPSVGALCQSAVASYRSALAGDKSRAAATLVSVVGEVVFRAQPQSRDGRWDWDTLESVAVDALSRVGGGAGEHEHAARDSYASLFRAGMAALGINDFDAQNIFTESKPHYLSSKFLHEWVRTRSLKNHGDES